MNHSKGQAKVSRISSEWLLSVLPGNDIIKPDICANVLHEPRRRRSAATNGVMDLICREEALSSTLHMLLQDALMEATVKS